MNIEYKIRPYNKKWYHDTNNNIINYSTNLTSTFIYDSILKELNMLCLMKSTSKIAKVYVEHIDAVKQINFIFTIGPRMKYFKVGLKHSIDFQFFLGNIFNNIKHNNYQLDALCLHIPTTGDEILEDVNETIKYENLPGHVTIQRVLDHVYLKWT
ncbi:unnamed protein product [Rotaria magnacalcarata]|uniref:Uncharacterized protein n=2 Tax=Rotaria magnacalcarata TaxID=392030 RepID=A0A816ZRY6_9BILA|nr:unnamed protein product [Rotaria magnacalcarata]CAF1467908.1 unnamed protein product [Rotaria magnacalcarata]CAF2039371.1 unnamed protein product [Rotaria magnacalcarata]CAF2075504.1 unnamed protein product [Rotaria magnacalcarata]CAF2209928.1 unnamed protein product [Rotaria magnacalcarata]